MQLTQLLKKDGHIVTDGAMGTYYSSLTDASASFCELANIQRPALIAQIHREYLDAGATLLRTNTFSANTAALHVPLSTVTEVVRKGYEIAADAAGDRAVVAADMSTIYANGDEDFDPMPEYRAIADTFLHCGATVFLFETLSEVTTAAAVAAYIRQQSRDACILFSFTLAPDGRTRSGVPLNQLLQQIKQLDPKPDGIGLNCGCGPTHLYRHASALYAYVQNELHIPVMILPNAGYPAMEQQRMVFNTSPAYFAEKTAEIYRLGIPIVGGCCGTTPEHIRLLAKEISYKTIEPLITVSGKLQPPAEENRHESRFSSKLEQGRFVLAGELDPPYGSDISKLVSSARLLRDAGVDVITISDSPLARAKMDSIVCAAKIKRDADIEALPHLCCRDKNVNALRSSLLGAHCEGIRTMLVVTGDHVPESDRGYVKPVFNVSSIKLMELMKQMNTDVFQDSPMTFGGALNPAVQNAETELTRLTRKMQAGATFFLTQPVFDSSGFALIDRARTLGAKVLVGIMPLVSFRNASYMSNEVPGIHIPAPYLQRFDPTMTKEEAEQTGIEIAVCIAREARSHADGFYLMTPFNRAGMTCKILEQLRAENIL